MNKWLAKQLAKKDRSLVGFWPLLDNVLDYSGRRFHGKAYGTAAPSSQFGKMGYLLSNGGADDYIEILHTEELNFERSSAFSISFWLSIGDIQDDDLVQSIISKVSTGFTGEIIGWEVSLIGSLIVFSILSGHSQPVVLNVDVRRVQHNRWIHVLITYDGSSTFDGIRIYINGFPAPMLNDGISITGSIKNTSNVYIGRAVKNLVTYKLKEAAIANVQIYKREITSKEASIMTLDQSNVVFDDVYIPGEPAIPLFIWGYLPSSANVTLYVAGHGFEDENIPLYIPGYDISQAWMPLTLKSGDPSSAVCTLYIDGSPPGVDMVKDSITLFLEAKDGNKYNAWMPLTLIGADTAVLSANMPLFVSGAGAQTYNTIPLYIHNEFISNSVPLFIDGEGGTPGAIPSSAWMPLFIERPFANWVTLYIKGPAELSSEDITLFISGAYLQTGSINLAMPKVTGLEPKDISLFVSGWLSGTFQE